MFFQIYVVLLISMVVAKALHLTPDQQRSVRKILANPNTTPLVKLQTQNLVFDKYYTWAKNVCAEYIKKRQYRNARQDLEQTVASGLLLAIRKYDWARPTSFPEFAKKYVLGAVFSEIRDRFEPQRHMVFTAHEKAFVSPTTEEPEVSKEDVLSMLDAEERRLFEYAYGHLFEGSEKRSVKEICDLMAYGNRETMRIKKRSLFQKIAQWKSNR